jgi:histidinol dehydrogenase
MSSLIPAPLTRKAISGFAASRRAQDEKARATAERIAADVRLGGFKALARYSRQLDGFAITRRNALASRREMDGAEKSLLPAQRKAMLLMKGKLERFARLQKSGMRKVRLEGKEGFAELRFMPVERVGIYVPAGRAPLFSSLFMAAVPAQAAGVEEIIVCTPQQKGGGASPLVLAAARMCGVRKVFKIGGAQAIAAMACGIGGMMAPADVICGPGNAYVSAAKQVAAGWGVRIDVPAGPTEVLVIADGSANPAFVAADMLAQAEHGPDSAATCICTSEEAAWQVSQELSAQLAALPESSAARVSIPKWGRIWVAKSRKELTDAANNLAPEHLELMLADAEKWLPKVKNAGAVFLNTGEAFCDYGMSGGNHVLPTSQAAKAWGGISVQAFGKWMYIEELDGGAQGNLAKTAALLARMEGLEAHARAAEKRLCYGNYRKAREG